MLTLSRLLAAAGVSATVIVLPGPGVLFIIGRGVSFGRRAALATVAGHDAALLVQVVLVAAGVGAVLERSIAVFTALKLVGAAYLIWLGVQAVRARRELASPVALESGAPGLRRMARQGFVVGITNPKSFLLFASILPQFVDPGAGPVPPQLLLLGVMCVAMALVSDSAWALATGTARRWLARSPRRLESIGAAGGVATVGLGVRLALTGRHD